MEQLIAFLNSHATLIGTIAALGTIIAFIPSLWKFWTGCQSEQEKILDEVVRESQELGQKVNSDPKIVQVWAGTLPPDSASDARALMTACYALYYKIYRCRRRGKFPESNWRTAEREMQEFLAYDFVRSNLNVADLMEEDFGRYMRNLKPKLRQE